MASNKLPPTTPKPHDVARLLANSAENLRNVARLASETMGQARQDIDATATAAGLLAEHLTELADDLEQRSNGGAS
jgi:hypothetical protein